MKKYNQRPLRHALAVLTAGLVLGGLATANAQNSLIYPTNVYYMSKNVPTNILAPYSAGGGVPAQSLLILSTNTSTNCTFSWYGMRGWSTIQGSTDLVNWLNLTNVAATNYAWTTTITNSLGAAAYFRLNQNNTYVGQAACAGCHIDKYNGWTNTPHSYAVREILNPDGSFTSSHASSSCLLCHTVGDTKPTGYVYTTNSASYSSGLANVGCEDCHGPAGWHKASEKDMITPAVSLDPAICGSCHQGHNPQYTEYTNKNSASFGFLVTGATHAIGGHGSSLSCGICHQANTRTAMVKEYYDRLAGNPHPITLFSTTDADAWAAACATCHDPHGSNNVAQLRYPTSSTNWFGVNTVTDPTPVLMTNSNGTITTNAGAGYNTAFESLYNPKVQVCGQCHAGGGGAGNGGMRWDGSTYGWITNLVVSTNVTAAGYVPVTTYVTNVQVFTVTNYNNYIFTNGGWVDVPIVTTTTNPYVIPYVTNQVWMASVTSYATNLTRTVGAYYPLIAYTNSGTVYYSSNSSSEKAPHYPVQYNVLIGQLDYDLAARGGPANVLTDAHTLSPNQCADCHVPSYTVGSANVTGHTFANDYNSPACLACHNMNSNALAADTLNFKLSVSNSIVRVVSLLKQWGTDVAPPILRTNYGTCAWEYASPLAYFGAKSTNGASKYTVGPPTAYNPTFGPYPSGTNDNVQLNYVPQDIRMARFSLYVLYEDQSYGVHNPTYTSNLLAWAENDVITNFVNAQWPATFTAGPLSGSLAANTNALTVSFTNYITSASSSSYNWTFGDPANGTANGQNPTYIYTTPGLYTVTCTVNGQSLTRTNFILVQP